MINMLAAIPVSLIGPVQHGGRLRLQPDQTVVVAIIESGLDTMHILVAIWQNMTAAR